VFGVRYQLSHPSRIPYSTFLLRYAIRNTQYAIPPHVSRFTFYVSRFIHHALRSTLLALLLFLLVGTAAAQDAEPTRPVTDNEVNQVAKELFCPVCESTPLDVCPTQACADWREVIRQQLSEGRTEEEIRTYFVEQYGDRVLAAPPRRGFNWLIWIGPLAALLVALILFVRYLLTLRRPLPESTTPPPPTPTPDDYIGRLEQELRERE
jgi:cytochrome c-type biogenesis protein CcmH